MSGWTYMTRYGRFSIIPNERGRWLVMCCSDSLGSYHSPTAAHDDLIGDHCGSNPLGVDTSRIGLPEDLAEWDAIR